MLPCTLSSESGFLFIYEVVMKDRLTEMIQLRAPNRLARALEREARRRMMTKSAYIRLVLAERLGLLNDAVIGEQENN